jgi:hypothetical protein
LVFTGIRTILGLDTSETRRVVISVIIGAVLINFSLFLTKAAIDVSNIFTAWITEGIKVLGGGYGVSDSSISVLGMQKLAATQGSVTDIKNWNLTTFGSGIALVTLNCIAIYVFFKVAFLMLGRLVSFILLLIMSPIGFVGHLVPKLDAYAKDWRDELTKACLMAPMFLLMLYITLFLATKFDAVLSQFNVAGSTNSLVSGGFGIPQYALFAIIAMMMLKSLKVAEEYTGAVAGQVGGVLKSAAMLATGTVATRFIGGAASALQSSKFAKDLATSDKWLGRVAGRTIIEGSGMAASAGFGLKDARSGLGLDKVGLTKTAFKGAEGGRKGDIKAYTEEEKKYAESFGDDSEGLRYRAKYASETRPDENSAMYRLSTKYLGESAAMKASGAVSKEANDAYRKAEVEGAKKDVATASNKIIEERMAIDRLEQATKSNEGTSEEQNSQIDEALGAEKQRLADTEAGLSRVDKKGYSHVTYKQYKLEQLEARMSAGPIPDIAQVQAEHNRLAQEIESELKTLPADQQKKIKDTSKVKNFVQFKKKAETRIEAALQEKDTSKKKALVMRSKDGDTTSVGDIIQSDRIGLKPKNITKYKKVMLPDGVTPKLKNGKQVYAEDPAGTLVRTYRDGEAQFVQYDPATHKYDKDKNGNTVFTDSKGSLSEDLTNKTRDYSRKKEVFDRMEGKGKKPSKEKGGQVEASDQTSDDDEDNEE